MFEPMPESYSPGQLPGHILVDVSGERIGTIMGVGTSYADVATDRFHLATHMYVPFDEIGYCTDSRCYLKIPIDQVHRRHWSHLPEELPSTGTRPVESQPTEVRIPFRSEEPKQRQAG